MCVDAMLVSDLVVIGAPTSKTPDGSFHQRCHKLTFHDREHVQVGACVFAFRGTRLTKAGTVAADLELLKDRDAELYYSARALRHMRRHVRRLQAAAPAVQWAFFTTGALRSTEIQGVSGYRVAGGHARRAVAFITIGFAAEH